MEITKLVRTALCWWHSVIKVVRILSFLHEGRNGGLVRINSRKKDSVRGRSSVGDTEAEDLIIFLWPYFAPAYQELSL